MGGRSREAPGQPLARRAFARVIVHGRWLVLAAWVAAVWAASVYLPTLATTTNVGGLPSFLPENSTALRTEREMAQEFGVPFLFQSMLVQRDPGGLDAATQARAVSAALDLHSQVPPDLTGITAAVPILNTAGLLPFAGESSTTVVTYFAYAPGTSLSESIDLAHRYADHYFADLPQHGSVVGVTGPTAGRLTQANIINSHLTWVEIAGVLAVALIVGWEFRSVVAPAVTLLAAVTAYVVATHAAAWGGQRFDVAVPSELEPLVVVLLLGVVTDYSVFFLNGIRDRLRAGDRPKTAVRHAVVANSAWVLGAGLAVAATTAVLVVARLGIFHALGPGMAVTVLTGLVVSLTLVPALLAVLGRAAFWPGGIGSRAADDDEDRPRGLRARVLRVTTIRPVAALVVVCLGAALAFAGWQVRDARMGLSLMSGLPEGTEASKAEAAAAQGFAPGITSPTAVVVQGSDVTSRTDELARFQDLLGKQPGVAGVVGPASLPVDDTLGVFRASNGDAARYAVVLDSQPLTAPAIDDLSRLRGRLGALAHQAGLADVSTSVGGDTALAEEIVDTTRMDMFRVAGLALLVDLIVLVLFLRSVLASVYLLVADALTLAATMGITTVVIGYRLDNPQFAFYVPFAVIVLLIAFGSDYEIFLVGRIWDTARTRPLTEAVVHTAPRAARAITIAGVALGASFATLVLVPLDPFREFALAMVVGVLLDVLLVRPMLVPSLIALFGRAGVWPRRLRRPEPADDTATDDGG